MPGWICKRYFDLIWSMFSEAALTYMSQIREVSNLSRHTNFLLIQLGTGKDSDTY